MALSVITVPVPASQNTSFPADRQIAGIGQFAAAITDDRRWRFRNRAVAIGAGEQDEVLLRWLTTILPASATLIGWQLDSHVMPLLIEAARTAAPSIARDAMTALASVMKTGPVDLAIEHGGAATPPLAAIVADHCIGMPVTTDEQRLSGWSWGEVDRLRADAADDALALWRLFLRKSHLSGLEAEAATDQWRRRRSRLRVVPSGGLEEEGRDEASGG